jgi:hypothetical protein
MRIRFLFLLSVWIGFLSGTALCQRGTITIPSGESIRVTDDAQLCADTVYVYGTLECASESGICPGMVVICRGTVIPSSLCASPVLTAASSLDFGPAGIGQSITRTLTIQNTGQAPLDIAGMSIAPPGVFTVDSGSSARTVQAGASIVLTLRFQPAAVGAYSATLTIANNSAQASYAVALTGSCVKDVPDIRASVTQLHLGRVLLGQNSSGSCVIRNQGNAALGISAQSIGGADGTQFSITDSCLAQILPGQSDAMQITFTPTRRGGKSARLSLQSNDPDSPNVLLQLSGTGIGPAIAVAPQRLDFNDVLIGADGTKVLTVSNSGERTLTLASQTVSGTQASEFSIITKAANSIDSGKTYTVEIRFTPASAGPKSATLTLASNDPEVPSLLVDLSGTGTTSSQPRITAGAMKLEFGNVVPSGSSSRSLVIRNTGTAVLQLSSQLAQGAAFGVAQQAAATIPPGDSAVARLEFRPLATGEYTGSFLISSNDPSTQTLTVTLHGSSGSTGPRITVSSTTLDYGNVQIGSARDANLVVQNIGSDPLVLFTQTITGKDSLDFWITQTAGSPIAPGNSATVSIRHRPFTSGAKSAKLVLASNDQGIPRFEVGLISNAVTDASRAPAAPNGVRLHQNYPNPFNPATTIAYELDKAGHVDLTVCNVFGETVERIEARHREAGTHRILWNADRHASGVYLAVLRVAGPGTAGEQRIMMILAK